MWEKKQSKQITLLNNDFSNFSLLSVSPLGSKFCLHQILFVDALQTIPVLKWGLGNIFKSTYLSLHHIAIHLYLQKGFLLKTSTPLFLRDFFCLFLFLFSGGGSMHSSSKGSWKCQELISLGCTFQPMSAKNK